MMSGWDRRWVGLAVTAVVVVLFAPTLVFGRVQLDDYWLWADDSPLRHLDAHTLRQLFCELDARARHPLGTEYLPVRDLVVALDMRLWGTNEQGPHVTQLALYASSIVGLGTLLERYGAPRRVAWLATLLWALHPLHVESVAWLAERKGVLAGVLVIGCGHAWCSYRAGRSRWWLVAATLAAVAAVWSKAPAIFGIAGLAALDRLRLPDGPRRWRVLALVGAATLAAAIPVVLVARDARVIGETAHPDRGRLVVALATQGHYVESALLVRRSAIAYPLQTDAPALPELALGALAVAGSVALVLWARRRARDRARDVEAILAWAWISFVPISHLIFPVHIVVADRFAYLWLAAPCVGVAALVMRLQGVARTAVVAALIGVLGIATLRAEGAWVSSTDLFARGVAANPRDRIMYENLAIALQREGRGDDAVLALDRGLGQLPDEPHLLSRKATLLFDLGRHHEALAASAAAAASGAASAMWTHAVLLQRSGRFAEALSWADLAAHKHPELVDYVRTRASLLVELGRFDEAAVALQHVLLLDPGSVADRALFARLAARPPRDSTTHGADP